MLIALVPVLVMLVGILLWALAGNAKLAEAGRLMFFAGVLVMTWSLATHAVRVG